MPTKRRATSYLPLLVIPSYPLTTPLPPSLLVSTLLTPSSSPPSPTAPPTRTRRFPSECGLSLLTWRLPPNTRSTYPTSDTSSSAELDRDRDRVSGLGVWSSSPLGVVVDVMDEMEELGLEGLRMGVEVDEEGGSDVVGDWGMRDASAGEREEIGWLIEMEIDRELEMDVDLGQSYTTDYGEHHELSSDHRPESSHPRFAATISDDAPLHMGYEADIGDLEYTDDGNNNKNKNKCVWLFRAASEGDGNDGDDEIGADELERKVNQQVRARRQARSGRRKRDGTGGRRDGSRGQSCSRRRGRRLEVIEELFTTEEKEQDN